MFWKNNVKKERRIFRDKFRDFMFVDVSEGGFKSFIVQVFPKKWCVNMKPKYFQIINTINSIIYFINISIISRKN